MKISAETEKCIRVCWVKWNEWDGRGWKPTKERSWRGRRRIAGTLACEIHMGSLYYREFPFGGYCEEAPVARGVAFFPSENA